MNVMIFDTETTDLNKPFCYNIGYIIYAPNEKKMLVKREFIVDQIWYNLPLFSTAYYAEKRPLYVSAMKGKKAALAKLGHITQKMSADIRRFEVECAYAFNSSFDEKVFTFNCDYFKVKNPFDNIPIFDIRGLAHQFLCTDLYFTFCEAHELFTDSGNYSSTAEALYRFLKDDNSFEEAHTALADSKIETEILQACLDNGAELCKEYQARFSLPRKVLKTLTIWKDKAPLVSFDCYGVTISKDKTKITLK